MKKTREEEPAPRNPFEMEVPAEEVIPWEESNIKSLFSRQVNGGGHVRSIQVKRTLVKPLIAMAHQKELLFECKSDIYLMDLPAKNRGAELSACRVVDGVNIETAEECILMLNELMVSAFKRGGYRTMKAQKDNGVTTGYVEVGGESLINHAFAFREGIKKEGKGYRAIETVEIEVSYN